MRRFAPSLTLLLICAHAGDVRAAKGEGPGIYGEFNGALSIGLSGGVGIVGGGSGEGPRPLYTGQLDLLFLSSAGIKLGYQNYSKDLAPSLSMRRDTLAFDVDVRPLFLALFLTNRFTGNETLDMLLYGIGFEIGFSYERGAFSSPASDVQSTWGFHLGLGFELPLIRGGAHALFLRLQFRATFAPAFAVAPPIQGAVGRAEQSLDGVQLGLMLRYRFQIWSEL